MALIYKAIGMYNHSSILLLVENYYKDRKEHYP